METGKGGGGEQQATMAGWLADWNKAGFGTTHFGRRV